MSRKTVSFSVPAKPASVGRPAPDVVIEAHSDDWVSDRHARAEDRPATSAGPSLLLDLAAERGLMEVVALSLLAPFALGFFWLINTMTGRMRF